MGRKDRFANQLSMKLEILIQVMAELPPEEFRAHLIKKYKSSDQRKFLILVIDNVNNPTPELAELKTRLQATL